MQTDLFESTPTVTSPAVSGTPKVSFLERYRFTLRLDQAVAGVIGVVILFVFVFSFGVESGKKFAMAELKAERAKRERMAEEFRVQVIAQGGIVYDRPAAPPSSGESGKTEARAESKKEMESVTLQTGGRPSGHYTIQLVTYASKEAAERQIKTLAEKGFQGFIIPSGRFQQVCVNGFETLSTATETLRELRSQGLAPQDAYVRNIA